MTRRHSPVFWIALLAGLPLLAIAGMWLFVLAWRPAMHPNPELIESVPRGEPLRGWSGAVERARGIVRAEIGRKNIAGVSVGVGALGHVVWAESFGWANVRTRARMTPETRFRIGTASQALTAAAAGALVEKGGLTLDDDIRRFVPQFAGKQERLTLRQLLGAPETSGSDTESQSPLALHRCETAADALQYFPVDAVPETPGMSARDARYGWVLVSAAVEAGSRQPFLKAMRELIFAPLQMDRTGAESTKEENPDAVGEEGEDAPPFRLVRDLILEPLGLRGENVTPESADPATVYAASLGPDTVFRYGLHVVRPGNLSCFAGSMELVSTATDLVRFGMGLFTGGTLKSATVKLLQVLHPGGKTESASVDGVLSGRTLVSLWVLRGGEIVVAVMSNSAEADTPGLARSVAEVFAAGAAKTD